MFKITRKDMREWEEAFKHKKISIQFRSSVSHTKHYVLFKYKKTSSRLPSLSRAAWIARQVSRLPIILLSTFHLCSVSLNSKSVWSTSISFTLFFLLFFYIYILFSPSLTLWLASFFLLKSNKFFRCKRISLP
jgi:hypothetical protein